MVRQHNRRIFAGYYKHYDGQLVYVAMVVPDAITGELMVIFHEGFYVSKRHYKTMPKTTFCQMIEIDGEWVDVYSRQVQYKLADDHIYWLEKAGLEAPIRKKEPPTEDEIAYDVRGYRQFDAYTLYAKDICTHYKTDVRKYNLCVAQKRLIGVFNRQDFEALKEDIAFLRDCLKTVLESYAPFFKERYIEKKSIRKYAEEHGINRGSVDYLNKKFIAAFAAELKARDEADGKSRLRVA